MLQSWKMLTTSLCNLICQFAHNGKSHLYRQIWPNLLFFKHSAILFANVSTKLCFKMCHEIHSLAFIYPSYIFITHILTSLWENRIVFNCVTYLSSLCTFEALLSAGLLSSWPSNLLPLRMPDLPVSLEVLSHSEGRRTAVPVKGSLWSHVHATQGPRRGSDVVLNLYGSASCLSERTNHSPRCCVDLTEGYNFW